MTIHDLAPVYHGLKDFQLASVEHAAAQLYAPGGSRRFLVADEVGLGKTMIARGIIAKAIEHHLDKGTERIDVVYVCSNGDIARQNIRRLNVIEGEDFSHATRLTMLPRELKGLQEKRLNFVSFTPGTSFNLRSAEGVADERALIHNMLRDLWGDAVAWGMTGEKVFAGYSSFANFARSVANDLNRKYDKGLLATFGAEIAAAEGGHEALQEEYRWLHAAYSRIRARNSVHQTDEVRRRRSAFVGRLRELLAHACVDALEPDLVILDEFQRFKHLFDDDNEAGALARTLFTRNDVAVLLLSATPYKMYTHGEEDGEDHYEDFLHTVRFLLADDGERVEELGRRIADFRRSLFDLDDATMGRALEARAEIEATLRTVMSRNERLAATANRSGMLEELTPPELALTADDVRRYVHMHRLGERIDAHGSASYWEATPYPLTFMSDYVFSNRFEAEANKGNGALADIDLSALSLSLSDVERYRRTDPGNVRMRALEADVIERGLWQLLWLPPSLPYHQPAGPFAEPGVDGATKRLVFSAWNVVPTAVSTYLTYEAERRMAATATVTDEAQDDEGPAPNTPEARKGFTQRLNFTRTNERLAGMPVLALLYPSVTLARIGDPLEVGRTLGSLAAPPSLATVLDEVRDRVAAALNPLTATAEGRANDRRWYWAAPFLLDHAAAVATVDEWLSGEETSTAMRLGFGEAPDNDQTNLRLHLDEAAALLRGELELGRPPEDLVDVIAEMAMAGPAVAACRAIERVTGFDVESVEVQRAAASVAWGLRSLFNDPVVTGMVAESRGGHTAEDAYWRHVLEYCLNGGLQSVLDEWGHVLVDSLGVRGRGEHEVLTELSGAMRTALTMQTVNYRVRRVEQRNGRVHHDRETRMRAGFARRFGAAEGETDQTMQTAAAVRIAFNSPFRPFVLATTSVGQEGLDFHTYCHAVVHWNLPSNPVDLEQREGRVHRYKGHAVRRNLAATHRAAAFAAEGDPWEAMFQEAAAQRGDDGDELIPYWVYATEGGARIERYVPALPMSREAARLEDLRKTTAAYRLVFGQPRQEDLIRFLDGRVDGLDLDALKIDLRPGAVNGAPPSVVEIDLRPVAALKETLEQS